MSRDLFTSALRRTRHDGRPAQLIHTHVDPRITRPDVTSTRLNDGLLWIRAAWAEVLGLNPVIRWHSSSGTLWQVSPWKHGRESALRYLHEHAEGPRGGMARKYLADLRRRDIDTGEGPQ